MVRHTGDSEGVAVAVKVLVTLGLVVVLWSVLRFVGWPLQG